MGIIVGLIVAVAVFVFVGIGAAILIPTVAKVREAARRTVDASNLRQIVQASLIHALENGGNLPEPALDDSGSGIGMSKTASIHLVAAALARDGGLTDATVWFAQDDQGAPDRPGHAAAVQHIIDEHKDIEAGFRETTGLAWDYATGLNTSMPPGTPVAWTRGLQRNGKWSSDGGVYGSDGGYIAFLGGHVLFFTQLSPDALLTPDGEPTSEILQALPVGTRIMGSGPASLHGSEGLSARMAE